MSESETTSQQLPTNKIYNILREILDFYIDGDFKEDVLDIDDCVMAIFRDGSHGDNKTPRPSIDVFNIDVNAGRMCLKIFDHNTSREWLNVTVSRKVGEGKFIELDFCGPTYLVKSIYTDQAINNIIRQDFYNFLLKLNVNMVKVLLV